MRLKYPRNKTLLGEKNESNKGCTVSVGGKRMIIFIRADLRERIEIFILYHKNHQPQESYTSNLYGFD